LFSVEAGDTSPFSYQWNYNGTHIAGATNAMLSLTSVQRADQGNYAVLVTNIAGSVTRSAAILTVTNPVFTLSVVSGSSLTASGFTFQVSVPARATYVVLTTTDFINWTPIATNVAVTGNDMFTDVSTTNCLWRFYRAMTW